ncbi:hypothetical protein BKA65DRAFT_291670 [Rhexocercosporidium sp. MPI-PUGE-AT-0058]|nr:hypothetical protein BKA65DRAFT_291670 [Rhexocercosporidium sp. MPI-PUGE-AT-0058]
MHRAFSSVGLYTASMQCFSRLSSICLLPLTLVFLQMIFPSHLLLLRTATAVDISLFPTLFPYPSAKSLISSFPICTVLHLTLIVIAHAIQQKKSLTFLSAQRKSSLHSSLNPPLSASSLFQLSWTIPCQ